MKKAIIIASLSSLLMMIGLESVFAGYYSWHTDKCQAGTASHLCK